GVGVTRILLSARCPSRSTVGHGISPPTRNGEPSIGAVRCARGPDPAHSGTATVARPGGRVFRGFRFTYLLGYRTTRLVGVLPLVRVGGRVGRWLFRHQGLALVGRVVGAVIHAVQWCSGRGRWRVRSGRVRVEVGPFLGDPLLDTLPLLLFHGCGAVSVGFAPVFRRVHTLFQDRKSVV